MSPSRRLALCLLAILCALALPAAPAAAARSPKPPRIEARGWGLIDARTGAVLASHALERPLPIASTTKLMTAYVAMKEMRLDEIVRARPYDAEYGESVMGLRPGQRISVRDLLYGLILRSGNDAAHTLAVAAAGSEAAFVGEMNRYAAALGLSCTHYANPVGLDQKGNHSCAGDLMTLTRRLLAIPAFAKISRARRAVLTSVHPRRRIETINELLRMAPWVTGVKTGHTFGAQYVLVGSGRRHGVSLISVVIGTWTDEERFEDSLALLEYGFSLYRERVPVRRGQDLADAAIRYSGGELPLRAARSLPVGLRRGQRLRVDVEAPAQVAGPLRRGARLGRATVLVAGRPLGTVPLVAGRRVPAAGTFDRARTFVGDHLGPIAVALFVILMVVLLVYWRWDRRQPGRESGIRVDAK